MYLASFVIGIVLALVLRRSVCELVAADCFRFTVQSIPVFIAALVGLTYWLWRWFVLGPLAKRTGQSAEHLGRNSSSPVRKTCLGALALALGWLLGSLVHVAFVRL